MTPELKPEAQPSPGPRTAGDWIRAHAFGLCCMTVGLISLGIAAFVLLDAGELTKAPDPRLTVPCFIVALATGVGSLVRKEGNYSLAIIGTCSATAAMLLGWVFVIAIVAAVAGLLIAVLSEVF